MAAERLHSGLLRNGNNSRMFYRTGNRPAPGSIEHHFVHGLWSRLRSALAMGLEHRRWATGGFVTSPRWIARTPLQKFGELPDIVNLHWISRWLDLPSFFASLPADLPVVWSLHDMNPFTGGCHHALDCTRFTEHCRNCPQLRRPGGRDHAFRNFQIKHGCYQGKNLHIVGNSEWTTAQAQRSALLRHARSLQTIPLGIDTEVFRPVDKNCARQALGIADSSFVVGFSCADFSDTNKGGALLVEALEELASEKGITLVTFGGGRLPDSDSKLRFVELGSIQSPRIQSLVYSACDVFVAPSLIESFGLTALEANACGTPVVAFKTGGLVDVVADGETGLLEIEVGSIAGLGTQLRWMLRNPDARRGMGVAARQRAEKNFTAKLMAERYSNLYADLLRREQ